MNSAFVDFIVNLAEMHPETAVAGVLARIMLERHCIEIEGQDAFSPDEHGNRAPLEDSDPVLPLAAGQAA